LRSFFFSKKTFEVGFFNGHHSFSLSLSFSIPQKGMYTLLSGLLEWATAKEEVRVILLGLDGAGKTTTLQALRAAADRRARGRHALGGSSGNAAEPLPKARPTVGLNVGRLDTAGAAVMLWDLGGAAGLRVIWDR
jgi:ADP-ribosylation factor related protein 1